MATRPRAFAAVMLLLFAAAAACGTKGEGLVLASKGAIGDDTRFVSSDAASQAYADVAATLLESTKRCEVKRRVGDARCAARAAAAGFFQIMANEVIGCDRDGRARSRAAARAALRTIDVADHANGKKPPPQPPAVPRC